MTRILLADDEVHITSLLARKLEQNGLEVDVAHDGEEAWLIAQERTPHAVITDLQMPYMNGVEFVELLRANAPTAGIPIIMLTARGYVLETDQADRLNIAAVMPKPFSVRRVVSLLESLLADRAGPGASLREVA
ncbi:MAG: response regulator [Phycisphaerales bacterium]|nr:response regulator [Phycisphaerales bacterium]